MTATRFAIIDPSAGASGDMLLGALIAAGAPRAWLEGLPVRLGCGGVRVDISDVDRCGLAAVQVVVRLADGTHEGPAQPHSHGPRHAHAGGAHAHDGHAPHRHVGDLIAMIEAAPLSGWVRERAVAAFRLLGDAEGRVHGVPAEQVALHEVGALDALVDIVGTVEGFEQLGITRIFSRPVAVGSGWVHAAHGQMPVPAPATAVLLEGLLIGPNGPVLGEATTPTGAALLRALSSGAPPDSWRPLAASAWGAGGRDPEGYPNALRLIIAEAAEEASQVVVLATDIDDLNPEYLEPLRGALLAAGALDVQTWPTYGKKGRIGIHVEALAEPAGADAVEAAYFRHSTTLGVRRWRADRTTLARRTIDVPAEDGTTVRVKLSEAPNGISAKPEYDDIIELAVRSGRPAHTLARELQEEAIRLAGGSATGRDNPN
jgi:uncharacterized protein (TIGR00299 family) protein